MRPPARALALAFFLLLVAVAPAAAAVVSTRLPGAFVTMMPKISSSPASTSAAKSGAAAAATPASCPSPVHGMARSPPSTVVASSWFGGDGSKSKDPQVLVRQGMDVFRQGDVQGSIEYFDEALAIGGSKIEPYLWQRGLSLYYAGRYKDGADQFRKDVAVNPADTEESIWAFLCEAQLDGFDKARKQMLVVQTDPRPYMRRAYELFMGKCTEEDLAKEGATPTSSAAFYALLYLGLYAEARGEGDKARNYIQASVATPYGKAGRDFMTSIARVHLSVRGWV